MSTDIGIRTVLQTSFEQAVQKATDALKTEGFGVLTQIDVQTTLKQKIDVEFRRYLIPGGLQSYAGSPCPVGQPGRRASAPLQCHGAGGGGGHCGRCGRPRADACWPGRRPGHERRRRRGTPETGTRDLQPERVLSLFAAGPSSNDPLRRVIGFQPMRAKAPADRSRHSALDVSTTLLYAGNVRCTPPPRLQDGSAP